MQVMIEFDLQEPRAKLIRKQSLTRLMEAADAKGAGGQEGLGAYLAGPHCDMPKSTRSI